jgi:hypothetical protein
MAFRNIYNFFKRLRKGYLHDKWKKQRIVENNRKDNEEDVKKGQRRWLLYSFVKIISSSPHKLARSRIRK